MTINLTLTEQEAANIFNILGQLPTQSNAHSLWQKIGQQIQKQLQETTTDTPNTNDDELQQRIETGDYKVPSKSK